MKVFVLGLRGFPNVQGGIETHCQNLYPRIVRQTASRVIVCARKPYVDPALENFEGVDLISLDCSRNKYLETLLHTYHGVWAAKKSGADILHLHAVGPSVWTPLAKLLGLKVVVTHHGQDYKRQKWNLFARLFLRFCEMMGMLFADRVIAVGGHIAALICRRYHRDVVVIPNGVSPRDPGSEENILRQYRLEKRHYILAVGRLVPEKGFHDLVDVFIRLRHEGWKLVVVGQADHADAYSKGLESRMRENPDIVMTGFLGGKPLQQIFYHAGLFVLPSYHEGLPIVLLEAMSAGLSCIASDIPGNREVCLQDSRYFPPGDQEKLAKLLTKFMQNPFTEEERRMQIQSILSKYDWDKIAERTFAVYRELKV